MAVNFLERLVLKRLPLYLRLKRLPLYLRLTASLVTKTESQSKNI